MILRHAKKEEAEECYKILNEGRMYQRSMGFNQWLDDYPVAETVLDDIKDGIGYVFADENGLFGYCAIVFTGEPVYPAIEGKWLTDNPYGVVHRIAFSDSCRGKGISHEVFGLIKDFCLSQGADSVRIDTMKENKVMRHVVEREGFSYCGIVYYHGSPRLAYELPIDNA